MRRRTGTSLIEVLVAIFITAIGLIALLALFPLGALSMAQAIRDNRAAQAAANAEAVAEALQIRNDPVLLAAPNPAFTDPDGPLPTGILPDLTATPGYDGPSYPVFADPVGTRNYSGAPGGYQDWVAGSTSLVPRRSLFIVENEPPGLPRGIATLKWFTLLDDLFFNPNGIPTTPVQREGSFSWAYLLRRPRASLPSVVDLSVVVFHQRALQVYSNSFVPLGETEYPALPAVANGSNNVVTLDYSGQGRPAIRTGSWILDTSVHDPVMDASNANRFGVVHGLFYRVVGVTDGANLLELELQTPLKAPIPATANNTKGKIVFMENVTEVFELGAGRQP